VPNGPSASIDIANQTQSQFIPWDWYITPNLPDYVCPSSNSILVTFGVVNVLVSLLNLIMGHRKVVNKVTFGLFGKELGNSWMFMFLMPLGVQLGANAFIAFLYQNTPGYEQGFSITDLMLFYTTRPRLGWIVLSLVMHWGRIGGEDRDYDDKIQDGYYEGAAKGAILAEIFLLVISSYYYGRTVHFAATHGYYLIGHLKGPYAHDARIMYVGAISFIVALYGSIFYLIGLLGVRGLNLGRNAYVPVWGIGCTTWLASWLFWGGYVTLAKDL
jgi:hypothetical protein